MKQFSIIFLLAVFLVSCGQGESGQSETGQSESAQSESSPSDGDFLALCERLREAGGYNGAPIVLELDLAERESVAETIASTASYYMADGKPEACVNFLRKNFLGQQSRGESPRLQ